MPDKNTKKSIDENLVALDEKGKGFSGKLNQERAYEILSQGVILTMEDDLKEALTKQTMKVDLIPEYKKKEERSQEFSSEKPVFNPFQKLEEVVVQPPQIQTFPKPKEVLNQDNVLREEDLSKEMAIKEEMEKAHKEAQEKESLEKGLANNVQNIQPKIAKEEILKEVIENSIEDIKPKEAKKPEILKEIIGDNAQKIKQNIDQKIFAIDSQLKEINPKEDLFAQKRKVILDKVVLQKKALENFAQKVEAVRLQKIELEKQEQSAKDSTIRHSLEEQRWGVEEKFKKVQDLLWNQEEEIEKAQLALSKIDKDLKDFLEKKTKLTKEKLEIQKFLDNVGFVGEREKFLSKNKSLLDQKSQLELLYNQALSEKEKQEQEILTVEKEEQKIENELRVLEDKIQKAVDTTERRRLEQERRELTQKRQIQEKKRWEIERKQEGIKNNFKVASENFSNLKKEEDSFNQKLAEIEARIDKEVPLSDIKNYLKTDLEETTKEEEKPHSKPAVVKQKEPLQEIPTEPAKSFLQIHNENPLEAEDDRKAIEQIRSNAREKEQEVIQKQFVQKQVLQEQKATKDEFDEIQERENREKAIAKLKQIAEQEQKKASLIDLKGPITKEEILKKLTKVSLKEEGQRKDFLSRVNKGTKVLSKQKQKSVDDAVIFHPMIRKNSLFEKIAVRTLIVLTIIGIGVGVYFGLVYLNERRKNVPPIISIDFTTSTNPTNEWPDFFPDNSTTTQEATSTLPNEIIPEEINVVQQTPPQPLIPVATNNILSYQNDPQQLTSLAEILLKNNIQYNSFEQVSIFDETQQRYLDPKSFFEILGAKLPVEFGWENTTTTILIFSSKFGNRLGFIIQTESSSVLKDSFFNTEQQAEQDTSSIFNLMGKAAPAFSKSFINIKYKTNTIRCQTFTKSDLGICYLAYKDYFILASSFEQVIRIVDKLP